MSELYSVTAYTTCPLPVASSVYLANAFIMKHMDTGTATHLSLRLLFMNNACKEVLLDTFVITTSNHDVVKSTNSKIKLLTSLAPFLPFTEQMERQSRAAQGMSGMYIS